MCSMQGRVESGGWADPAIQSDDKLKPLQFAKNIRTNEQTSAVDLETSSFYACMSTHFPTANYFSIKGRFPAELAQALVLT